MSGQKDVSLYAGHATPANIILRALPALAAVTTTIFLYAGHATPENIILGDPTVVRDVGGFPTQFSGLRLWDVDHMIELCLVAEADAVGGLRIDKNGTTYGVYLVDTSDGNASPVRIRTGAGTKAVRLKT